MDKKERLLDVRRKIEDAALRSGRRPDAITLIAVSKTFPEEDIAEMAALGQVHFGENKVQELVRKHDSLSKIPETASIVWHFIGHLQRNKTKDILGRASLFHGLDSVRLGNAIQSRIETRDSETGAPLDCLVQVNVSGELSKFGISPKELDQAMDVFSALKRLNIKGLMTLARPVTDPNEVRDEFALLRELAHSVKDRFADETCILSMGMSSDFEVAIEEGATHVRLGSLLFGSRSYMTA